MKKNLALILAACLMLCAAYALAATGNVTIAVQGQDGFNDFISGMQVWGDKLLLSSYNSLYAWNSETRKLVQVQGSDQLQYMLTDEETGVIKAEEDEYCYFDSDLYVADGKLYRMAQINDSDGNQTSYLVEIIISDDGEMSLGDVIDLGDALSITNEADGETYSYTRSLQNPCSFGRTIYALSYGDSLELLSLDLDSETVDTVTLDTDYQVDSISPYTEGKLLMIGSNYNVDPIETALLVYDTQTEEITELGKMPRDGYNTPSTICYDEARSKVYYVLSGSVWRMDISDDGFGTPEEFGDMPLESYSNSVAVMMGDWYILSSYDGVVGRDVTLDKMPPQRLRIINSNYAESIKTAYYAFTDKHPEYMVSISDNLDESTLLQSMMNRDSSVDIYTISSSSSALSALMNRGYLAELGSSEKLTAAVDSLYPFIRDFCKKDGQLYLMPFSGYATGLTMNTKALTEKLGYTQEDVPTSWKQLFELIDDIVVNKKLEEAPEVSFVMAGYTQQDLRGMIFSNMMRDYYTWLDQSEENLTNGTPVLLELCEAFEKVDWSGLGLPEEYSEDGWMSDGIMKESVLIDFNSVDVTSYVGADKDSVICPLSVVDGEEPVIGMTLTLAFVNPFSENKDAAIEYLEDAWDANGRTNRILMNPNDNEPVVNAYYEQNLKEIQNNIDQQKKSLETMTDEETREMTQNGINSMEEWLEEYKERGKYDVTPEQIAKYREVAGKMAVAKSDIYGGDSYDQMYQYVDGAITASQFAAQLEKTLQMQRLEGN